MKIISLQLCNFRQFYGKTPVIYFATGEQNTTVFHGNNGSGKTTILNAFTWVFYEKFTAAFASPDLLVNKRAIRENDFNSSVECSVTVEFEHDSLLYRLQRKLYVFPTKNKDVEYGQNKLYLTIAGDNGCWNQTTEAPQDIIEGILPVSLHQYFFFDGEKIDHISRNEQRSNLAEDTKELIGIKVLERSLEHLKKAKRTFQDELKAIGDNQVKQILHQQHKLEQQQEILLGKIDQINHNLQLYAEVKQNLNQQLLNYSEVAQLQKTKIELESQEKIVREKLIQIKQEIKTLISRQAFLIFLEPSFHKFQTIINELREKQELPSGIKQDFVQQLLNRQQCICGHSLEPGTTAYQTVESWTKKAGIAELEEIIIRLEAKVQDNHQNIPEFWDKFDNAKDKINNLRTELNEKEQQIDVIKEQLRQYPQEDIKEVQNKLDETEKYIRELTRELGGNQQEIKTIETAIAEQERQIQKHQAKEEKQTLVKRRITATEEVIERINQVKTLLEQKFRVSLETKVQEIFQTISFTPYLPRLNENYELTLVENTSGKAVTVAASTGENQILSLSFIGGIIDRVREWNQKNKLIGPDSSTFPEVMDSTFGSLDEIYRRQVAKSLPVLANQLVMMVTKTQWRIEVEKEIQQYLGKQYVLVYHSPKPDCEEDYIYINNVSYPLVQKSPNNFEYTEIVEVQ